MPLRSLAFNLLALLIAGGAACPVGEQYGMKLIVDAMALDDRHSKDIWRWLALFVVLIAAESAWWRPIGWLGCRAVVASGVHVRLDMLRHLSGHSQDYFSQHMAGSLGNRVTAAAGASGSIFGPLIWKILPPCVDFVGALRGTARLRPWRGRSEPGHHVQYTQVEPRWQSRRWRSASHWPMCW